MAVFEDYSGQSLDEARATGGNRGAEYADSWHLDNQHPLFTSVIRKLTAGDGGREADRLVRTASLVDTKITRIVSGGPFKRDNYIDLINYLAFLAVAHEEYDKKTTVQQLDTHLVEVIKGDQHTIVGVQPEDVLAQQVGQLNGERCTV